MGSWLLLLFRHHPDFPNTRFERIQKAEKNRASRGGGQACVRSKLLAVFLTEELAGLPRPHSPLTGGLHRPPTEREWELERVPIYHIHSTEVAQCAAPGTDTIHHDSNEAPRGKSHCEVGSDCAMRWGTSPCFRWPWVRSAAPGTRAPGRSLVWCRWAGSVFRVKASGG